MGIMVYSLLWVLQDLYHQPYTASGYLRASHFAKLPDGPPESSRTLNPWFKALVFAFQG